MLCLLSSVGCIKRSSNSEAKIIGGTVPVGDNPALTSAVALANSSGDIFCSGTLIANDLVVTAAHCIGHQSAGTFQIAFGPSGTSISRPVTGLQTYKPQGAKFFPNFDVAWVRFSGGVPAGYQPIEILRDSSKLTIGGDVSLAGYGFTSTGCNPQQAGCVGTLLSTTTSLSAFINANHARNLLVFKSSQHYGSCNGDSGGPAYIKKDNTWYLIGATNGQWAPLTPDVNFAQNTCEAGEDVYTFLGGYADWLAASSGESLPQSAANPSPAANPAVASVIPGASASFADWCKVGDDNIEVWFTAHQILSFAASMTVDKSQAQKVITDCSGADAAVTSALSATSGNMSFINAENELGNDQSVRDLRPLSSVTGLTALNLLGQRIDDASSLASLPLMLLSLSSNRSASAQGLLQSLSNKTLLFLYLNSNSITDVSPLADPGKYPALQEVSLDDNEIKDLSPLEALPSLTKLSATNNALTNNECPIRGTTAKCTFDPSIIPTAIATHLPVLKSISLKLPGLNETLVSQ